MGLDLSRQRVRRGHSAQRSRRAQPGEHVSSFARTREAQRGVTGLETAIIMIAFVVVASVFAMTTLKTGIFAAEQGQ
jgi:flagellin-like protein